MTRDKARKSEIRASRELSGRRYTPLARELAARPSRLGDAFSLADLLTECTTLPHTVHGPDCPCPDCNYWTPTSFSSRLVGVDVPHQAVLKLAGLLAGQGPGVELAVESLSPGCALVLVCPPRRFDLSLITADMNELCPAPRCGHQPVDEDIPWCHNHLADQDRDTLIRTATRWGSTRREFSEDTPDLAGGNRTADLLVRAAALHGWHREVASAVVDGCFGDPALLEESAHYWDDPDMPMRIRHAIDREAARLIRVAEQALRSGRARRSAEAATGP